jgi:hypothetical protein
MKICKDRKTTISFDNEQRETAKNLSKLLLGNENISGLFRYLMNDFENNLSPKQKALLTQIKKSK